MAAFLFRVKNKQTFADGSPTLNYILDAQGNLLTLNNGHSNWQYSYNSQHLLESETLTIDSKTYVIDPEYNNMGHLKALTYGGGSLSYSPNALGNATEVKEGSTSYASNVAYYASGQLKSFNYGNGLNFNQTLNSAYQPEYRQVKQNGVVKFGQHYQYDNNNNIEYIGDQKDNSKSLSMVYDGLDRLTTANGSWGQGSLSYDGLGNIKSKNLGSQQLTYSYNESSNRLESVTGGYSFSYDDRGNVTNNGKRSFSFNRANQLVNSGTYSYLYDGHNRRVKKSGSSLGYSVYSLAGQLLLTDGPQGTTRYIHLGSELIAKTGSAAALDDKRGYTGHLEDKDLALTYMQQRYYDPVIGRFYSNDPIGFRDTHSFNRYAYANNNPYKFTDPTGMASESENKGSGFCGVSGCDYSYSSDSSKKGNVSSNGQVYDPNDPNYHSYDLHTSMCTLGENGCTVEMVMKFTEYYSVPFMNDAAVGVVLTLAGNNPIIHFRGDNWSLNVTVSGHEYHPGQVLHVVTAERNMVSLHTYGMGTGKNPSVNNIIGYSLFGSMHMQVWRRVKTQQIQNFYRDLSK